MSDSLSAASRIATTGLDVQSVRLRIIAENIANAQSTGSSSKVSPYRRKTISFEAVLGSHIHTQGEGVRITKIGHDKAPLIIRYEPGHPAADRNGYVQYPNVNALIEIADMREANRSYEANLQIVRQAQELVSQTIDLLKG